MNKVDNSLELSFLMIQKPNTIEYAKCSQKLDSILTSPATSTKYLSVFRIGSLLKQIKYEQPTIHPSIHVYMLLWRITV